MEISHKRIPSERMGEIEGVLVNASLISSWGDKIPDWVLVWALQTNHGRRVLGKYEGTNVDIATEIINTFHHYYK